MITNVSFASPGERADDSPTADVEIPTSPTSFYLFPSFEFVTIPASTTFRDYRLNLDHLVRRVLKNTMATNPSHEEKEYLLQNLKFDGTANTTPADLLQVRQVNEIVVFICGHGGRDSRCGALGPPIQAEFERKLKDVDISVLPRRRPADVDPSTSTAHVGLISHIGGHKWAGNVIIYIPSTWPSARLQATHDLAGTAIWYGRVEPKHVEGIVQETIVRGLLIKELWRGGMKLFRQENSFRWGPVANPTT
jgi:(2Fe-2S) ferredoxin